MLPSRTHARKQGGYSQPVWPARVRPAYGEGQGISCPAWVLPGLTAPSYTLKEKPKPPINHFGLCGLKRVWGSYPKQSELITANEWLHVTASSASFPCTYGPLARGREPNQGGIRTAGQKSIRRGPQRGGHPPVQQAAGGERRQPEAAELVPRR
jgi:hypothetical protein